MKTLEKSKRLVGKYMAAIVIVVAALAAVPRSRFQRGKGRMVRHPAGYRPCSGMSHLKPEDFKVVFSETWKL